MSAERIEEWESDFFDLEAGFRDLRGDRWHGEDEHLQLHRRSNLISSVLNRHAVVSMLSGAGLPEELWLSIFGFLSSWDLCRLARVCRAFFRLHLDLLLWRNIQVTGCDDLSGKMLLRLLQNSLGRDGYSLLDPVRSKDLPSVKEGLCHYFSSQQLPVVRIAVGQCSKISAQVWPIALPLCPRLQHLEISGCEVSAAALSSVALCSNLLTFCCRDAHHSSEGEMSAALAVVLSSCTRLQHLDICGCSFAQGLLSMVNRMASNSKLKCLHGLTAVSSDVTDVAGFGQRCPLLHDVSCRVDLRSAAVALCTSLPKLQRLEVMCSANVRVNVVVEKPLQGHAENLATLSVNAEPGFVEDMLYHLVQAVQPRNLKHLSVCSTCGITDVAAIALGSFCPDLEEVVCESPGLRDTALLTLAASCRRIEHLDIRCSSCSKSTVLDRVMSCLPRLHHVALPHCTLSDDTLKVLALTCPQLAFLDCAGSVSLTDDGLSLLAMHCHHLRHLSLDSAAFLSDQGVFMLARGCHLLTHFCADASPAITDRAVALLAQSCTNLQHLSLASACHLSHISCLALAKNCLRIQHINFVGSSCLSDTALSALMPVAAHLSYLAVGFGDCASLQQLLKLLRSCRRLSWLVVCDRHHMATWQGQTHWRRRIRELARTVLKKCTIRLEGVVLSGSEQCDIWEDFVDVGTCDMYKKGSSKDLWWR